MQFTVIIHGRILEIFDCHNSELAHNCARYKFGNDAIVRTWDKTSIMMRREYMHREFGNMELADLSDADLAFDIEDIDTSPPKRQNVNTY